MQAAAQRIESQTEAQPQSEHIYAQRYLMEGSGFIAGFVDFVVEADGRGIYFARILQKRKACGSLAEAETFLRAHAQSGANIVKG
jgi:hypothetical protein